LQKKKQAVCATRQSGCTCTSSVEFIYVTQALRAAAGQEAGNAFRDASPLKCWPSKPGLASSLPPKDDTFMACRPIQ
jgi:hypothetical protein